MPTPPIAFLAGVLSFLSPCVLPLVPTYLAYVGGSGARRPVLLRNAGLFVLGFSLVFIAMGASASALGSVMRAQQELLTIAGGVLVIVFGLVMLGVIRSRSSTATRAATSARRPTRRAPGGPHCWAWPSRSAGPLHRARARLDPGGRGRQRDAGHRRRPPHRVRGGLAVPFMLAALAIEPFTA
jgi:cytochrome c-type biogenesis protein